MNCPICDDTGLVPELKMSTKKLAYFKPCPRGCLGRLARASLQQRLADGETEEEILGLKPAGHSIVEPRSNHRGQPVYKENT